MNKEEKLKINRRQRIKVLSRIEEYEKKGGEAFWLDVEDDPPHPTIMPEGLYAKKARHENTRAFCDEACDKTCEKGSKRA